HHFAQAHAALLLDDLAEPVDVHAIGPALARVVQQDAPDRRVGAGQDRGDAHGFTVFQVVGAEAFVAQPRRVQDEVVDRDVPRRWAGLRLAGCIEALEHTKFTDGRHVLLRRVRQADLAFLD